MGEDRIEKKKEGKDRKNSNKEIMKEFGMATVETEMRIMRLNYEENAII